MKYDRKLVTITILEGDELSLSYKPPIYTGSRVTGYSPSMQKKLDMMDKIKLPKYTPISTEAKAALRINQDKNNFIS